MYWNLIWKSPGFVSFGANLTNFGAKPTIPDTGSGQFDVEWRSVVHAYTRQFECEGVLHTGQFAVKECCCTWSSIWCKCHTLFITALISDLQRERGGDRVITSLVYLPHHIKLLHGVINYFSVKVNSLPSTQKVINFSNIRFGSNIRQIGPKINVSRNV